MSECIFCDRSVIEDSLISEFDNCYFRANAKGALAPGHSMIIPKEHVSCLAAMHPSFDREFGELSDELERRVEIKFSKPILIEQGIHGQSVSHAHLHFIPTVSEDYDISNKRFMDYVPKEIRVTGGRDIVDIRRIFEDKGQYVSVKENGQLYICHTNGYNGVLRLREVMSRLTGNKNLLFWQNMPDSEKVRTASWEKETVTKLR